jgi:hypothetical protein
MSEQDKALDNLMAWQQEFEKPVAWMSPDGKVSTTEGKLFYIPLYTAPQTISTPQPQTFTGENPFTKTRELSDEEILEANEYICACGSSDCATKEELIKFARAILKKASEK